MNTNKQKLRLAPEGSGFISWSLGLVILSAGLTFLFRNKYLKIICGLAITWAVLVIQFFRDPCRITPNGERKIVAPADGRIISIDNELPPQMTWKGHRVSIFMSPFNVHVNRSPVYGTVENVQHFAGNFRSAFEVEASRENERVLVEVSTDFGNMAFAQVAGFLARRIVFLPRIGDYLETGQRVGMIKFGSRVDVFLPENAKIQVELGESVVAGESIIGEF